MKVLVMLGLSEVESNKAVVRKIGAARDQQVVDVVDLVPAVRAAITSVEAAEALSSVPSAPAPAAVVAAAPSTGN